MQPPRSASEILHQGGANTPSLVKNLNSTDVDKKDGDEYDFCTRRGGAKQHDNEEKEDFVDVTCTLQLILSHMCSNTLHSLLCHEFGFHFGLLCNGGHLRGRQVSELLGTG